MRRAKRSAKLIALTLQDTRWNRRAAAERLGISYKALLYKIKDADLDRASWMTAESFEEDERVLTPKSFDFVLSHEVKRAVRTQDLLTLVVMEAAPGRAARRGGAGAASSRAWSAEEVRETDLLSRDRRYARLARAVRRRHHRIDARHRPAAGPARALRVRAAAVHRGRRGLLPH